MADLTIIVTNAGRAALLNAENTGTAPVVISHAGITSTGFSASPATTAIPNEIKRIATLSGDVLDDETMHLVVRDESADQYSLRSFGLYLGDGTLFAVYGQATPIIEKSTQSLLLLAVDVRFADINAASLTFGNANFLNPPATTDNFGVVELATEAEATTGTDAIRVVTAKGMKTAVTAWLNTRLGDGAPSAFVKGLLTAATAAALRLAIGLKGAALKDEGHGNGLDADLLDGQQGAYYLPAAAFSAANTLTLLKTVDGAGSGLDADLLDGQTGNFYAPISNPEFLTDVKVRGNLFFTRSQPLIEFNLGGPRINNPASNTLIFGTDPTSQRMFMAPSGSVNVHGARGTTGEITGSGSLRVMASYAGGYGITISDQDSGGMYALQVVQNGTQVGSITTNGTSTSFNQASDYRLKENIMPLTGALERLSALPIYRFNFISHPDRQVDGVLAHEAALIVPEAAHGEKDAVEDIGTATCAHTQMSEEEGAEPVQTYHEVCGITEAAAPEGSMWIKTGERPVYQGVDQSKLVPLTIAAVQELYALCRDQAARIEALEASA